MGLCEYIAAYYTQRVYIAPVIEDKTRREKKKLIRYLFILVVTSTAFVVLQNT